MNWKSAFIWMVIIVVVASGIGYRCLNNRIDEAYDTGYSEGYDAGFDFTKLMEEYRTSPDLFKFGYENGYRAGLKDTDAYWIGYDAGRDEGYDEGYNDEKAGYPFSR